MAQTTKQMISLYPNDLERLERLGKRLYPNQRSKSPTVRTSLRVLEMVLARNNGQLPQDMLDQLVQENES